MTTLSEAREAIYQLFVDGWTGGVPDPLTAYTFDNEDYDPPDAASWVRLAVRHQAGGQETLGKAGARKFARTGAAFVQIFVAQDDGTATMDSIVENLLTIFEGVRIAGTTVRFLDVNFNETGPDGKWFSGVLEATFEYDETK